MKKIILILVVFVAGLFCNELNAQKTKFGHVDYAGIIELMPETDSAQVAVKQLKADLEAEAGVMQQEFQAKYEDFAQKQATYSPAVAKVKQKELEDMYQRLQAFAEGAQSQIQAKQVELLEPVQQKVLDAIKEVAKAENFTYVFDISTVAYGWDTTDLTDKVKAKLGVK
ncbi:MAG: OmpH family outer membrane protein [Bacteroidales bacterium]|nr:OmpH family outer membrane protein [Bacteroidales bacterium]